MHDPKILVRTAALVAAGLFGLACGGVAERDCTTDGGAIHREPREVVFTEGNKSVISIQEAGEKDWRRYDRIVQCDGIEIDSVSKSRPGVTEFLSARISEPLLYDESKGTFSNTDGWRCDF